MSDTNPKLSILLPGIRVERWPVLYKSIKESFSGEFELIIVGPKPPNFAWHNVHFYEDWGSPIRCQQIALLKARSEYLTWMSDDGVYLPGELDRAFATLEAANPACYPVNNIAVTCRYLEGDGHDPAELDKMRGPDYYRYDFHDGTKGLRLPDGCLMLNVAIVPRMRVLELGGWDCRFESTLGWADLAVRLQRSGLRVVLQDGITVKHDHMPGRTGDHAPMHDAQVDHDEPLFRDIYSDPTEDDRTVISLYNWKDSPARWERRFGKE